MKITVLALRNMCGQKKCPLALRLHHHQQVGEYRVILRVQQHASTLKATEDLVSRTRFMHSEARRVRGGPLAYGKALLDCPYLTPLDATERNSMKLA